MAGVSQAIQQAESAGDAQRVVAVLLARGGSKGIPGKNLRPIGGVSLVARAVARLHAVPAVSRVVVSTDDPAIASEARAAGAEVPFTRPATLAQDDTPALCALEHAVRFLVEAGETAGVILLHQVTSPFCSAAQIAAAIERFLPSEALTLRSVTPVAEHPHWMGTLEGDRFHFLTPPTERATRRQDLPPLYRLNGAIQLYRTSALLAGRTDADPPLAFVMDAGSSLDLDTPEDWERAVARLGVVGPERTAFQR